jgi:hypothetical protein
VNFCGTFENVHVTFKIAGICDIMRPKTSHPAIGLQPYEWVSMRSVEVARRLNLRCLALIARVANMADPACELEIVRRHRELWGRFDGRACQRAARVPIVLLDCHFSEVEWWNRVMATGRPPAGTHLRSPYFSADAAAPLLREILVEGRTIAISEPRAASLILGAPSGVVSAIASLTSTNIDEHSASCANELRPRWEDKIVFWKNLLDAAVGDADGALSEVCFHSLQLLGSELMGPQLGVSGRNVRPKPQ